MKLSKETESSIRGFTIVELLIVIVVIAILAAVTIVGYNGIIDRAKTTSRAAELSQWKKKSEVYKIQNNIDCPENYVFVYGSSVFGTSDFCVMKYEAKNVGGIATSEAAGLPWVSISHSSAVTASIAAGGHLITEAEWMTIAADVLSVKYNWTGGEIDSGYIYQGHINSNPSANLAASTDDNDTLNGMTGGFGTTSGTNSSRALYLKSGDAIWDLSGNVWEWTSQVQAMSQVGVSGDGVFNNREWSLGSLSVGNLPAVSRSSTLSSIPELGGITWSASKGVGRVYANYADTSTRAFNRGGGRNTTSNAGVLSLYLGDAPSLVDSMLGFRVAR